ncbi:CAP domain-containing protein [Calothrix sp. PCC 6303]|uniref:CAP domain-containing protein n=1 Tax=Calothrix sp. PCC 6303 TaxID=1170562 RepID=UPI0002A002A9|nr:CAP domain-containing protein [Calothrix sp. PCC 6303]AFZ02679.1 SCP-like extracellular [Calothrix sp. PCC 6303]
MIRQTAFCFALSTLVFASGLTANSITSQSQSSQSDQSKSLSTASSKVAPINNFKTTDLEKSVFEQINRYRVAKGLSKLTLDARISKQARIHSQNMAVGKVPFSHKGFEKRVNSISIGYQSASENVAFNQGYDDPVAEAVSGWIKSPGHLVNIKGNYNLTGVGVAVNREGEVYLTQLFLRSR